MPGPTEISIDVTTAPEVSYAMAYNRVPVVDRVEITAAGPKLVVTVHIWLDGPDGPMSGHTEQVVELGSTVVLIDPPLPLDATVLAVTEQTQAAVVVQVQDGEAVLARRTHPVRLLPGSHWSAGGPGPTLLAVELLAAFVRPQDPALQPVIASARDQLQLLTGSSTLDTDGDPMRADAVAAAVFGALAAVGPQAVGEPTGWSTTGRLLAAPGEVLSSGHGGHLDRALLLAAAFELAGLAPLIWLTDDAALTGYWREPHALTSSATTEAATVANLVDLSLMRVLVPDFGMAFSDAIGTAIGTAVSTVLDDAPGTGGTVLGVLDVAAARRDGIRALPVRKDGTVVEHTVAAPTLVAAPLRSDPAGTGRTDVPARVTQWKNRLLDLTLRNRLINFTDRGSVALTVSVGQLAVLEDVVNGGDPLILLPGDQVGAVHAEQGIRQGRQLPAEVLAEMFTSQRAVYTDVPAATYGERMRGLAYKARTAVEETGANNLFLTLGMLSWSLDGRDLRSPLALLPVRLVTRNRGREYRLELDDAGTSTPNYCLLEKLRQATGLTIPGLAEPLEDGAGIDLAAAVHAVRVEIARAGLPYRVEETAHLGVLAFAKYRLWRDLDLHWSELADNPLVRHLIESPTEAFVDPTPLPDAIDLDDLASRCPLPADSSQLGAVASAVAGRTFVLEGPPGTGKSQTITNLLARAVAGGSRVLFVAEKRAALDVVMRRLTAIGLGPLCLDLHDKGSRPVTVRAQLRAALDLAVADDPQGLAASAEQRRSAVSRLAAYTRALHDPNGAGLSYYSAATSLLARAGSPTLPVPTAVVQQPGATAQVTAVLITLVDVADPAGPRPDHPWGWLDPADPPGADPAAIRSAAIDFDAAVRIGVGGAAGATLARAGTPGDLAALATFASSWAQNLALLDEVGTVAWSRAAQAVQAEVAAFADAHHPVLAVAAPQAMSLDVEELHARALAAAGSSWFGRRRRLQAVITDLAGVLRGPLGRDHLVQTTAGLVDLRRYIRDLAERATLLPGIELAPDWNPLLPQGRDQLDRQIAWYHWASASVRAGGPDATRFTIALREFVAAGAPGSGADRDALQAMAAAGSRLGTWTDDDSVRTWSGDVGLVAAWLATADARHLHEPRDLSLQRWLSLLDRLGPLRAAGAGSARSMVMRGEVSADDAPAAWEAGVASTSLVERAAAHHLDSFDPVGHGRTIERFTTATSAVRDHLVAAIPAAAVRDRTFDSRSVLGQIGELQRELAKQRRGLPVRGLMSRHGELITAITPCVLVSPDSLARFFPPRPGQFDLVVFDEASQIRVPDAIGAMGRGNSVVVVGDSRQLPPTAFAEAGNDDDSASAIDGLAVPDEESILSECVQARLPQEWLSWHYRSVDEALISFSNHLYYQGRLSSFPAPASGVPDPGPRGHGICLVRVPGEFLRSGTGKLLRTNPVEATAVVNEIRARFADSPDDVPSIGVVTFNAQQRTHIESLLRDLADESITAALDRVDGEGLFVKNLENVQGDERDVILFSTAFAANRRGVLPLNFGPLNRSGGERRLNVAVTRARRQVIVFSSFDPEDLRAEQTSSLGVKHLRAYLDLAAAGTRAAAAETDPDLPWTPSSAGVGHRAVAVDRHRDEIAAALRSAGLGVRADVGLSEFTIDLVVSPDPAPGAPPVMAVLLDGPAWAARRTVGDRDGLPVDVLFGQLGWPVVERVWLPEWRADPGGVVDRLTKRLQAALEPTPAQSDTEPDPLPEPARASEPEPVLVPEPEPALVSEPEPALVSEPAGETDFHAWQLVTAGPRGVLDRLHTQDGVHQMWQVLVEVIDTEGPVHHARLAGLAGAAFGWSRLTPERRHAVLTCLPPGLPADPDGEPFAWPLDVDPLGWSEFRRSSTAEREVDEISLTELGNAAAALARAAAGMHVDQLRLEVVRCFGFSRRTAERDGRVDAAVRAAIARGRLERDGELVTSPVWAPG